MLSAIGYCHIALPCTILFHLFVVVHEGHPRSGGVRQMWIRGWRVSLYANILIAVYAITLQSCQRAAVTAVELLYVNNVPVFVVRCWFCQPVRLVPSEVIVRLS